MHFQFQDMNELGKCSQRNEKVKYVSYIKIDVQGADFEAVKSGGEI